MNLKWKKAKPELTGWYWIYNPIHLKPTFQIIHIRHGMHSLCYFSAYEEDIYDVDDIPLGTLFCGPIKIPKKTLARDLYIKKFK